MPEIKRIKLKNKSFTIKVELKNIIKRITDDKHEKYIYSCDVYIHGKLSYKDEMFYRVTDLDELYEEVIIKIGHY